jgi:methionyl-tRNA formyltransferase
MTIGLLCSGNLGYKTMIELHTDYTIRFVFTDANSESIITHCGLHHIPVFIGNPRHGTCRDFIKDKEVEVIVSVNYIFLIDEPLLRAGNLAFNIHGSLLPKYRGRTPHVWAIINNEKVTGITAHVIDEGCDTGPVLEQIEIQIQEDDTGGSILQKFSAKYPEIIKRVLVNYAAGRVVAHPQDNSKATYFGKRTAEDGMINWSWQRERIKNWVRAQAYPYPGAFTFYKDSKIVIDEVRDSDIGFTFDMPDGLVLSASPLVVKTPNGGLELIRVRGNSPGLVKGGILN